MQQQLGQWNTWSGWQIRIWVVWTNQIRAELRGPLQRAYGVRSSIIICFRKAQDEPYICYEDSVLRNRSQQAQIRPFRLLREDLSWTRAGHIELDEMIWAELRGPLQRACEIGSSIIICFRKAQDDSYKCYEDSIFYNGLQNVLIQPLSFMRSKTIVALIIISNYLHDLILIIL